MSPSVHVDLTPDVGCTFEDHENAGLLGKLDDLHRIRCGHHPWAARRQAVAFRIVFREVLGVVVVDSGRPRHERDVRFGGATSALTAACRGDGSGQPVRPDHSASSGRGHLGLTVWSDNPVGHVGDIGNGPDTLLPTNTAKVRNAIRQTRGWTGGRRGAGALRGLGGYGRQPHRNK